jgi:hypothetical protein
VAVTDEWEVRLTLAVDPPPDQSTVLRMGTAPARYWSGVGLAEGSQGITRLALDFTSAPTTPHGAVSDAFEALQTALADEGLTLERVIDVAVVSATRDERDW